ncbi:MAG TPA: HAD-IA family hydrolase [Candidatus Dojkabacteria bacterium]|nr:HAD-IA family hydrolase [Candidatus Dojkabacteria bacterium]
MNTSKYKLFLLDWDGCLAMTLENWMQSYLEVYSKYGICVTRNNIVKHSWGNLQEGPKFFGFTNYDDVWKEIVNLVTEKNSKVEMYEGSVDFLKRLKASDYKVAIVTSSEKKIVLPAIEYNNLNGYIDLILTEEDVDNPKPHKDMAVLAMRKLQIGEGETIIMGDTSKDIICGQNAGIDTVLILHKENEEFYDFSKMRESNPTYVVKNFSEIEV